MMILRCLGKRNRAHEAREERRSDDSATEGARGRSAHLDVAADPAALWIPETRGPLTSATLERAAARGMHVAPSVENPKPARPDQYEANALNVHVAPHLDPRSLMAWASSSIALWHLLGPARCAVLRDANVGGHPIAPRPEGFSPSEDPAEADYLWRLAVAQATRDLERSAARGERPAPSHEQLAREAPFAAQIDLTMPSALEYPPAGAVLNNTA